MFRMLLIIGMVLMAITVVIFIIGLSAEAPIGSIFALLCGVPLTAYFLGGATFSFVANYQITPRSGPVENRRVSTGKSSQLG
jgi:hypothetical protein